MLPLVPKLQLDSPVPEQIATPLCVVRLDGRFPIVSVLWRGRHVAGCLLPFVMAPGLVLAPFLAR